jgi:hypothetical protein
MRYEVEHLKMFRNTSSFPQKKIDRWIIIPCMLASIARKCNYYMGPTMKKRAGRAANILAMDFSAHSAPSRGRKLHGRAGANFGSQFLGFTPNIYQMLWACQIFGVVGVGCKPNIP